MIFRLGFLSLALFLAAPALSESTDLSLKSAVVRSVDGAWRANLPRDPQAATKAYLDRVSSEALARSNSYYEGTYWLILWGTIWALAASAILFWSGFAVALRGRVHRWLRRPFPRALLYSAIFFVAFSVLNFPLSIYQDFIREHQYGMANQTFGPWFVDQLMAFGVSVIVAAPLVAIIYAAIRRWSRTWPVVASAATLLFLMLVMAIAPIFIQPLFNTYTTLPKGELRDSILSLARANGIPASEIYQFDASKQTQRVSANVAGMFGSARIQINDNLLRHCDLSEIRAVMGHEMGHYVLNHINKALIEDGLIVLILFFAIRVLYEWLIVRFGSRFGVVAADDLAAMPMLFAAIAVVLFLSTPVFNTLTRTQETEADIFGLNAAREADGMAELTLKLIEYRKPDPGPIEEFIFYDHPSARARIFMAMQWKAENPK